MEINIMVAFATIHIGVKQIDIPIKIVKKSYLMALLLTFTMSASVQFSIE